METIADVTDTSLTWCDFGDFTDIPIKGIRYMYTVFPELDNIDFKDLK